MKEAVLEEMRHHFRPEFLNRVDEIIVFHALSRGAPQADRGDPAGARCAPAWRTATSPWSSPTRLARNLVRTGYDPHYGARPLKRAIQKKIETPLGRLLLKGAVRDGDALLVDAGSDTSDLTFAPQAVAAQS